jgi:hypothetical protein
VKKMVVMIPPQLARDAKILAMRHGTSVSAMVCEFLEAELRKSGRKERG